MSKSSSTQVVKSPLDGANPVISQLEKHLTNNAIKNVFEFPQKLANQKGAKSNSVNTVGLSKFKEPLNRAKKLVPIEKKTFSRTTIVLEKNIFEKKSKLFRLKIGILCEISQYRDLTY